MTETTDYVPPKVWTWNKESGGRFAAINRPIAGPTHDKELPIGKHPLQLYSLATPNGVKVTVMLEELLALGHKGAEYDAWLINIGSGDQFGSGFVAINPNSKIPALMDRSGPTPIRVFESGAILIHLAETFGAFLPTEPGPRAETLSWLMWQMGSAPYLGGGFGHFYAYAPTKIEYAIDRFAMEVKRQLDVLDRRLGESRYLAGDDYTIADIAVWPWYGNLAKGLAYESGEFLSGSGLHERPALDRRDRPAPGRQAGPHGQPRHGRPSQPTPRTPRGVGFRDQDPGQAGAARCGGLIRPSSLPRSGEGGLWPAGQSRVGGYPAAGDCHRPQVPKTPSIAPSPHPARGQTPRVRPPHFGGGRNAPPHPHSTGSTRRTIQAQPITPNSAETPVAAKAHPNACVRSMR